MLDWNTLTNKQGLIVWGGVNSSNYGIVVEECPAFDKPKIRTDVFNIPGRNGSVLFQDGSFDDVARTYKIWVDENTQYDSGGQVVSGTLADRVNAFTSALYSQKGYQKLTDNFEPDTYRLAYLTGGQDFTNELIQYGKSTLQFTCRPERFLVSGDTATAYTNGDTITNPTLFDAKPLIHIEATNQTVTVSIGGKTITAVVADYINIDCERMNAYRLPTENRNDKISGSFPVIKSGSNTITTTGTITKLTVTPRYYNI